MGNCGSNPVQSDSSSSPPDYDNYSPLSEEEIMKRIVSSESSKVLTYESEPGKPEAGTFDIRYAYVSQKGYYPNGECCDSWGVGSVLKPPPSLPPAPPLGN